MSTHQTTLLAQSGQFRVDSSPCGVINLHLGQISIRVSPRALIQLADVFNAASDNYLTLVAHLQSNHCLQAPSSPSEGMISNEFMSITQKADDEIH